ncbi:MAG: hypothetical protein ACJA16_000910 [Akkermansiaceae bacterium]|jgi:hypothetical protein
MTPAPASIGGAGERIGRIFRRVLAVSSRAAAGRPWPQVEPFRRPTAIPLDPKSSSAALVPIGFLPKTFFQGFGIIRSPSSFFGFG